MKSKTVLVAKAVAIGTGAIVAGPLGAAVGHAAGGYFELLLTDTGLDAASAIGGVFSNLFADVIQKDYHPSIGNDLRICYAQSVIDCLDWQKGNGPISSRILDSITFKAISPSQKECLSQLFSLWRNEFKDAVKRARKPNADFTLLNVLFPQNGLTDAATIVENVNLGDVAFEVELWQQFYERTINEITNRKSKGEMLASIPGGRYLVEKWR